jgi:hypothetical protein
VWSFAVFLGHADELMAALNPVLDVVVVEDASGGGPGWYDAQVALGGEPTTTHRVRGVTFDLLVTPSRALEVGPSLRTSGSGQLFCWQAARLPGDKHFRLSTKRASGMRSAMAGLGIELVIDLPHDAEVAVLSAQEESVALAAARRLRTGNGWVG